MNETERIADQLKRAFYGKAWSGPSVRDALKGVTPETAARKAIPNAHSIWELVHHITAWIDIARRRALGEKVTVTKEMNFPPVRHITEKAWKESVRRMDRAEETLRQAILQSPPALKDPKVYVLFHGAIQHSLYHAGQIVLLKKAADQSD